MASSGSFGSNSGGRGDKVLFRNELLSLAVILGLVLCAQGAQKTADVSRNASADRFFVREFGAMGDGISSDTRAVQSAIRAASKAGGGTVVFTPGTYLTGTLELLSNVTLDVEAGAVIQGSTNIADYGSIQEFGFGHKYGIDSTGEGDKVGLIVARNAENVGIVGRGVIDGSSSAFFDFTRAHYSLDFDPKHTRQGQGFLNAVLQTGDGPVEVRPSGRPGTMIVLADCRNVLLRDITLRNSPNWTLHLAKADGAVLEGLHILNDLLIPNNDGVDCMGCRNVHISDCDIRAGDDDLAIVGGEDITVSNCSLVSNSSGIRLEDTRHSVFSNLSIHANRGIGIYEQGGGTTASVLFSGIVIDTHLLTGHWWGKGEPIYIAVGRANGKSGELRDIRFSNISAEAENGILLYGDPEARIQDVSFDQVSVHLRVTRKNVNAAVGGNFDLRWTSNTLGTAVFAHNIPALYARYVKGLYIHGLQVKWADAMPQYYSSALELEDIENLSIERFEGRQALIGSSDPVIALRRANNVSLRDSRATPGASTFLFAHEVKGERVFTGNNLVHSKQAMHSNVSWIQSGNLLFRKQ